jgi:hypothetical protein
MKQRERRRAAVLLRTLADAEIARLEGDDDRVVSLLNSVDPVEARLVANELDFDAAVRALSRRLEVVEAVLRIPGGRKAW